MTGRDIPGLSTGEFFNLLKKITVLPVFRLCDPDPYGVLMLACYARGLLNQHMTILTLRPLLYAGLVFLQRILLTSAYLTQASDILLTMMIPS